MTALIWDNLGERTFRTGVDRGVLYLADDVVVVWNGLTSIEETPNINLNSYYLNGLKYLEYLSPGDFSASLKALTYPDEFEAVTGNVKLTSGLHVHDQPSKSFGLSYRTKIGNDLDGIDAAYLIHIIYNVLANPDSFSFETISDQTSPTEFSWTLSAKPVVSDSPTWRPTAHVSLDSREIGSETLATIEGALYGTDADNPSLLSIDDIIGLLGGP